MRERKFSGLLKALAGAVISTALACDSQSTQLFSPVNDLSGYSVQSAESGEITSAQYKSVNVNFTPYFPQTPAWQASDIQATQVPTFQRELMLGNIKHELDKHPESLLSYHLDVIHPLSSLTVNGNPWGGTRALNNGRGKKAIYLTRSEDMHHELSSLMLLNPQTTGSFPLDEWMDVSPQGSYITYDATRPLPFTDQVFTDSSLLEKGFLGEYGTWQAASGLPEEDVNQYFGALFTDEARLFSAADSYPRVNQKLELIEDWYNSFTDSSN